MIQVIQVLKWIKGKLPLIISATVALILLLSMFFCSCTCEKQYKRIKKKCPDIIKTDTVWGKVSVTVPPIKIDTSIKIDKDYSGVDSIIAMYSHFMDSLSAVKLSSQIKNYVINKPMLKDTVTIPVPGGGFVKLFQSGDVLNYKLDIPQKEIEKPVPIAVTNINEPKRSLWEKIQGFLLIFITCFILYQMLSKKKE